MKEYIIKIDHDHTEGMQELVRCKDCKHSTKFSEGLYSCMVRVVPDGIKYRKPDWFCADAERSVK